MRLLLLLVPAMFLGLSPVPAAAGPPEGGAPPPARAIPGITVEDRFPEACVSCHVALPEIDARLSTSMQRWREAADPELLAKVQGCAPAGVTLAGRHPEAAEALADVPAACMGCHTPDSAEAPDFRRMIHAIHLTGGEENHFLTLFQGECTHCHKFDAVSARWSVPSGREK